MSARLREEGWSATNRARLERTLVELSTGEHRRVAVFDWDNTMMRGDIGDIVLAHALENDLLFAPDVAELVLLTPEARDAMTRSCAAAAGERLATRGGTECGRVIAHLAWNGTTPSGEPGFTTLQAPFYRATYGFLAQMLGGLGHEELRAIAREAFDVASAVDVGTRETVAGVEVERFVRLNAPMVELVRALEDAGVEVWIVSASPQPIVEVVAERAGIARERVIGVRMVGDDRMTSAFESCGEGAIETPVMSWLEGKRCWINRVIFGLPASEQRMRQRDAARRPVLAAGDSDGDLAMLEDATTLRLVLDRHAPRVMCNALADREGWIVQELFVDPPPPRTEPYPCATHRDELGGIVDPEGRAIADQDPRSVDALRRR